LPHSPWLNELLFPGYLSALSLVLVFLHVAFVSVRARLSRSSRNTPPVAVEYRGYVDSHGGPIILSFEAAKFLSAAALTGLSLAAMLTTDHHKHMDHGFKFDDRLYHLSIVLTSVYAFPTSSSSSV
jgi:hypothetical protein